MLYINQIDELKFIELWNNNYSYSEIVRYFNIKWSEFDKLVKKLDLHRSKELIEKIRRESRLRNLDVEKMKQNQIKTMQEKYGVNNISKLDSIKNKKKATLSKHYGSVEEGYKVISSNTKKTKLERYNDSSYNNRDLYKETTIQRYNKIGYNNRNLYIETMLNRYGTLKTKEDKEKTRQTKLERYNDPNYNNREKYKLTNLERYGSEHPMNSTKVNFARKILNTKIKNGSFKKHKTETELYELLLKNFNDVERELVIDGLYFDFKINNLLIELNGNFWHNYRPFNDSEDHIKEYESLINKKSSVYITVANKWRYIDTKKLNYCIENKIPYLCIYFGKNVNNYKNSDNIIFTDNFEDIINNIVIKLNGSTTIENT